DGSTIKGPVMPKTTNTPSLVILDMLVGKEWRHLRLTRQEAKAFIRKTPNHRGYQITPIPDEPKR
ncbi:hypothetical protein ACED38_18965, partial [Vibrio cortegadensis]